MVVPRRIRTTASAGFVWKLALQTYVCFARFRGSPDPLTKPQVVERCRPALATTRACARRSVCCKGFLNTDGF
eukprot:1652319-Pyramimonas_sp.AAC.2